MLVFWWNTTPKKNNYYYCHHNPKIIYKLYGYKCTVHRHSDTYPVPWCVGQQRLLVARVDPGQRKWLLIVTATWIASSRHLDHVTSEVAAKSTQIRFFSLSLFQDPRHCECFHSKEATCICKQAQTRWLISVKKTNCLLVNQRTQLIVQQEN